MDVPTFFKERKRMCGYYKNSIDCCGCPLAKKDLIRHENCLDYCTHYPEESTTIVEKWAKEHPVKTYKSVFMEKFPDTVTDFMGDPHLCLKYVFGRGSEIKGCEQSALCHECWNREVEE